MVNALSSGYVSQYILSPEIRGGGCGRRVSGIKTPEDAWLGLLLLICVAAAGLLVVIQ